MPSYTTLKNKGLKYALGSALRKSGHDIEFYADRSRLNPMPNKVYDIVVDDISMSLDFGELSISKAIWQRIQGVREPETTAIIRSLLRPGDKVLELGSCFGYFTLLMSASVGSSGNVLGIEGLPEYYKILSRNIERNGGENVELLNAFVGSKSTFVDFEEGATSPYGGIKDYKAGVGDNKGNNKISVECINVARVLNDKNFHPSHIFMDIEGFEVEAIEQLANSYLRDHNPTFVFEHHEKFYETDKGLKYIEELLSEFNYVMRTIYGNVVAFKN